MSLEKISFRGSFRVFRESKFLNMNPMDVASHICANSWNYFSKITIEDILEGGKSKKIQTFFFECGNKITIWLQSEILFQTNNKMRALAIEKIIEIASYLKIWNNFHGLSTVVGALVGPAISRLKDCFDMIPSSYLKKMQKYEQYLNPQNNFQKYRKKRFKI